MTSGRQSVLVVFLCDVRPAVSAGAARASGVSTTRQTPVTCPVPEVQAPCAEAWRPTVSTRSFEVSTASFISRCEVVCRYHPDSDRLMSNYFTTKRTKSRSQLYYVARDWLCQMTATWAAGSRTLKTRICPSCSGQSVSRGRHGIVCSSALDSVTASQVSERRSSRDCVQQCSRLGHSFAGQ